jgi:KaiC domain protein
VTEDDDWFERALEEDDESEGKSNEAESKSDESEATSTESEATSNPSDSAEPPEKSESGRLAESTASDSSDAKVEYSDPGGFGDAPEFDPDDAGPAETEPAETGTSETESAETGTSETESAETGPGDGGEFGMGGGNFDADDSPEASESSSGGGGFADANPYDTDEEDEELFDEGFANAFENAPGGGMGAEASDSPTEGDGGGGLGGGGGFGGGGGGEFGMGSSEGFGSDGPPDDETFDDEELESSIPRIDIGIGGLDDMIQGGVPERSLITTIGSAGTGKTTFGLQFLHEALEQGESAVFITLEESHDRIVNTATEKGWAFDEYEENGQLAVIDLDPIEMANSLTSIRNDLPRLIEQFGATRLVLDSVSLLEMMYDKQATRRNEIYDFTKSLKEAGVTTMLTSEASEDNAYASRHGIIEYLVDGVFILRYIRGSDDFRETRLAVEIQKIRDANHSREIKPYSITNEGISVYRQANIF